MRICTSPFFYFHAPQNNNVATSVVSGKRYKDLSLQLFKIAFFFLEPKSAGEAAEKGITEAQINEAMQIGLLVPEEEYNELKLWEIRSWGLAGYLQFSQANLGYAERVASAPNIDTLTDFRRSFIKEELHKEAYPEMLFHEGQNIISLPKYNEALAAPLSLNAVLKRRCSRGFFDTPIPLEVFSNVLFSSSRTIRTSEKHRSTGDPFAILDSFFSWLNIYIAVQGVQDVPRGIYQYHPIKHQLSQVYEGLSDDDLLTCNAFQPWIGNGGFCLFQVAQWERFMWIYRHSRAYIHLMIQAGEFGQMVLHELLRYGLGAWMTPAVQETNCAKLLRLDESKQEAIYFMKVGFPKKQPGYE